MRIALFQPDIPQNTGTILRLGACLSVPVDLIEPAGFDLSDRALKRAGLDYLAKAILVRHESWEAFLAQRGGRIILFSTAGAVRFTDFRFEAEDTLLFGRESAGAPDYVHDAVDGRVFIPIERGLRSLNIAVSAAMGLGEALRQTGQFPD